MFCRANAAVVSVLRCFQRFEVSALNRKTVPESFLELSGGSAALSGSKPALPGTSQQSRRFSSNRQMPKKEKAVKGRAAAAGGATETSGPVNRDKSGALTITVRAKPGSQRSGIADVSPEAVGVSIAAPPADGEANAELIRYLAEVLDLKKTHVSLEKGSRSRDKLVRVDCSLSPEEVLDRLRQAAG
ncbi:unnamed protein product [Menidia menidia]|uniref:(Atlantic silverside) hypothetical protein n=1 Tax=Menidia menidia TaxID=238744 RepID=A0A8S4BA59_9TELE|nr:unnamed protein product [Menidia menidia]